MRNTLARFLLWLAYSISGDEPYRPAARISYYRTFGEEAPEETTTDGW